MGTGPSGNSPIILSCPKCEVRYEWLSDQGEEPFCSRCAARYPMACHDCGLDLRIDGFHKRPLKHREETSEQQCIWGLYCPECTAKYDRFAVKKSQPSNCAQCGVQVQAGGLRLRSFNSTVVAGAVAYHETHYLGLCPACAKSADNVGTKMLSTMVSVFVLIALFAIVCWLLN